MWCLLVTAQVRVLMHDISGPSTRIHIAAAVVAKTRPKQYPRVLGRCALGCFTNLGTNTLSSVRIKCLNGGNFSSQFRDF